jgi:hypothetical protein
MYLESQYELLKENEEVEILVWEEMSFHEEVAVTGK